MSGPRTEPSTPLQNVIKASRHSSSFSAPCLTDIYSIHLPSQSPVISELSSRRTSTNRQNLNQTPPSSFGNAGYASYSPLSNSGSRSLTPQRKLSDHLTIRRHRRSSTGTPYNSGYAGNITKDFLRNFSRVLARETHAGDDQSDDRVYKALDSQHRATPTSPADPPQEFDMSLPLPSEAEMDASDSENQERISTASLPKESEPKKPLFKSYLERILEGRGKNRIQKNPDFDKGFSESESQDGNMEHIVSISRFIIDDTLFGLPNTWNNGESSSVQFQLAEPVAFGSLQQGIPSDDSSERENSINLNDPPHNISSPPERFHSGSPDAYSEFDNANIPKLSNWDPISPNGPHVLGPGFNSNASSKSSSDKVVDSDSANSEFISGHLMIENDSLTMNFDSDHKEESDFENLTHNSESPAPVSVKMPVSKMLQPTLKQSTDTPTFPLGLIKSFVSTAQHLNPALKRQTPPRKKRKLHKISSNIARHINEKSNEFLHQLISDLGSYAEHRDSNEINISDAILYINRLSRHNVLASETCTNYSSMAQSLLPLENLIALDNSLQEVGSRSTRRRQQ